MPEFNFKKAVSHVLSIEKGYVNDENDPGGETKYGISKRSYPHLDIKSLTLSEAEDIYLKDYWEKCNCDKLPWPIAMVVFDTAVNQGVVSAAKMLQRVLKIKEDGIIGPHTITHAIDSDWDDTIKKFTTIRILQYSSIKNWNIYGEGWTNRAIDIFHRACIYFYYK